MVALRARLRLLVLVWLALLGLFMMMPLNLEAAPDPIPVIYDSDIGDDIDDTWALCLLLRSPEFDIKLVVGDQGKPLYRARLFAKLLQVAGRTDIPVGIGVGEKKKTDQGNQSAWVEGYELKSYPGKIHENGVQAIIDIIMKSPRPVTVIAVGPLPNIAVALERQPEIARRARFVGMHGSVRLGYGGRKKISAEYNVRADIKACQKVFTAAWDMTITPLDTCGLVTLKGDKYKKVRTSKDPLAAALIENYRVWSKSHEKNGRPNNFDTRSSTLFDTVAVYLAMTEKHLEIEKLSIVVDNKGYTRIDPKGKSMKVATRWKNMGAFEDFMVKRLVSTK